MDKLDLDQLYTAAHEASQLLKAISNEYRLLVLCQLVGGEKQVAELQASLDLSQSALSQHLAKLRQEHPERIIQRSVKGMLPKNALGRAMFKKLKVYAGDSHQHAAQQPQPLEI